MGARVLGIELDGSPVAGLGRFEIAVLAVGEAEVVLELGARRDQGGEVLVALLEWSRSGAPFEAEKHRKRQEEEGGPLHRVGSKPGVCRGFDGRRS